MRERDAHVATQGAGGKESVFAKTLEELGFQDDRLSQNRIIIEQEDLLSSCPIIDIHMSRKFGMETVAEIRDLQTQLDELFASNPEAIGYWHTETTAEDLLITPKQEVFNSSLKVPFAVTDLQSRQEQYKSCDCHFAIKRNLVSETFLKMMYQAGLYSISRLKPTGVNGAIEEWVVLTLQFVTKVSEGLKFFKKFTEYYQECGGPPLYAKFEITTNERVYRGALTPPTTSFVRYL